MTRIDTHPDTNCEAFYYPDGWYEIHEIGNTDGWIRTADPVVTKE